MQFTLHSPSPNQHWDVIREKLGQRTATKKHLPSERTWVFICREKLAGE